MIKKQKPQPPVKGGTYLDLCDLLYDLNDRISLTKLLAKYPKYTKSDFYISADTDSGWGDDCYHHVYLQAYVPETDEEFEERRRSYEIKLQKYELRRIEEEKKKKREIAKAVKKVRYVAALKKQKESIEKELSKYEN